MKVLDLFAGGGGFSRAFTAPLFTVDTLDNSSMKGLSKYGLAYTFGMDIRNFSCRDKSYDIVLAGVPCNQYAAWGMRGLLRKQMARAGKTVVLPDNELLMETLRVITECKARYYAIENVRSAVPFISAILGSPKIQCGNRFFWTNFPILQSDFDDEWYKPKTRRINDRVVKLGTAADRSLIEPEISRAFADSISRRPVASRLADEAGDGQCAREGSRSGDVLDHNCC
jgi:C-5 cytosine-specific DNA methylase